MLPYEELLRRRPPPAADAGSRSRAAGRRGQAPPQGALTDAGYPRPVQGGAPQCATNSPVDCSLARGRFPSGQREKPFSSMWFGPTYGNCCAGDRRLRRMQGAGAGPRVAESKPRPRGADRCGVPAPGTGRRTAGDSRTGHRSLLLQLRLGGYFYASVRGIAAQATAACGGCREPEQGCGSQRASPAQGALTDAGYPRPVQGGAPFAPAKRFQNVPSPGTRPRMNSSKLSAKKVIL